MSGFTPGPWRAVTTEQPAPYYSGIVALTAQSPYMAVVTDGRVCHSDQWEANARLIAAAPDLFAFAERYIAEAEANGGWDGDDDLFAVAVMVVAKARGDGA